MSRLFNLEELNCFFEAIFQKGDLELLTLSSPRLASSPARVNIRTFQSKTECLYQFARVQGKQTFHENLNGDAAKTRFFEFLKGETTLSLEQKPLSYKRIFLRTLDQDYQFLINRLGEIRMMKREREKSRPKTLEHNFRKNYLLSEGKPIDWLIRLGIMNEKGEVLNKQRHKFLQINRFLELTEPICKSFTSPRINIVDLGCGKGYLTFALYHHLHLQKGYDLQLIGVDIKSELMDKLNRLANEVGFEKLTFFSSTIEDFQKIGSADLVIALHACDTATDEAIQKALSWNAKALLCAPCCQKELYSQLKFPILQPILKHGILKERFSSLATEGLRALLLESHGYHTDLIEFIDPEHTPKNLLIRAIKKRECFSQERYQKYLNFKNLMTS